MKITDTSFENRYQNNLELMKGNEFVLDYVHFLYYKCHEINQNRGGSYICSPEYMSSLAKWLSVRLRTKYLWVWILLLPLIDSTDCIKNKKATIKSINKKDKYFRYTVTVALNHEEIGKILKE